MSVSKKLASAEKMVKSLKISLEETIYKGMYRASEQQEEIDELELQLEELEEEVAKMSALLENALFNYPEQRTEQRRLLDRSKNNVQS